jgi:hypothetical protein
MVVPTHNPSCSGGRDRRIESLRPAQAQVHEILLENYFKKRTKNISIIFLLYPQLPLILGIGLGSTRTFLSPTEERNEVPAASCWFDYFPSGNTIHIPC